MTDPMSQAPAPRPGNEWLEPGKTNIQLVYALYLLSFVVGITGLVGLVFAYLNRGKSEEWLETHYTWLIRTFWIGLVYALISALLSIILIGFLTAFATAVWFVVRCIIGLQKISRDEPIANPQSWII